MIITDMKTDHKENPVGFHMKKPYLQWKVREFIGNRTMSAEVRISKNEDMSNAVYEKCICGCNCLLADMPLEKSTRYYWQVEVTDELGNSALSSIAWFETAKEEKRWKASWITPCTRENRRVECEFTISKTIKYAVLSISGLGLYEAYIGGKKVGEEYLTPNFNNYESFIQFQTYHVEDYLNVGENKIEIWLGNGWYKGRIINYGGKDHDRYGEKYAAIAELKIGYEDGSEQTIVTDSNWKSTRCPVLSDGIYDGEILDDTVLSEPEGNVEILDMGYEKLEARRSLPIKVKRRKSPEKVFFSRKGELIIDFGQNLAGWVVFYNRLAKGETCRITTAEILQDDCFYHDNMRTAKTEFIYTSDGNEKWVRPHFSYFGFRYVKLEGFGDFVNPEDFQAEVLYSDMEETGKICTGNEKVNKLVENVFWSQRSNFVDVPTDCPQRDERLGWTGDAQIFAGTASFNMNVSSFFAKYLRDMRSEQQKNNGLIPFAVPDICFGNMTSAAWGDAATVIPWNLYMMYGNLEMLREQYPIMRDWVEYVRTRDLLGGREYLWDVDTHFGDWLALDSEEKTGATDVSLIASAFYYYSSALTARAAKELGYKEDLLEYTDLAENIKRSFQKEFLTANGRLCTDTQTAHALVLYMGLYENSEQAERLADRLEELLTENGGVLNTGFVGTHYLCPALSKYGKGKSAYKLLLNEKYPGWLYSVCQGATTIWERWNSVLEDGHMNSDGMNSLNHYAYGSILEWIYRYAAGLQPLKGGWKRFSITPEPNEEMKRLDVMYESVYGKIQSSWEYTEQGMIKYAFEVPFDTEAVLRLPGKEDRILYAGTYKYELPAPKKPKGYSGNSDIQKLLEDEEAARAIKEIAPGLLHIPKEFCNGTLKENMLNIFSGYTALEYEQLNKKLKTI